MWGFMNVKTIVGVVVFLMLTHIVYAQESNTVKVPVLLEIPAKASVQLIGSNLTLNYSKNNSSDVQVLTPSSAGKCWINYSSIVNFGTSNTIYASLGDGNVPAEISIKLKVGKDVWAGAGQTGQPTEPITLSSFPQPIITNIGSCYTGQGEGKGHELTYSWIVAPNYDPDLIKLEELNIVASVIYTIVTN